MYRRSPTVIHNERVSKHLNNGFRYALMKNEKIILVKRYEWELAIHKKANPGSAIKLITSLMK